MAPGGATGAPTSVILIVCAVSELHVSRGLRVCLNLKRKGPFGQVASISRSRFGSRRAGASDKHKKAREPRPRTVAHPIVRVAVSVELVTAVQLYP